jgi:hypothetical protein
MQQKQEQETVAVKMEYICTPIMAVISDIKVVPQLL